LRAGWKVLPSAKAEETQRANCCSVLSVLSEPHQSGLDVERERFASLDPSASSPRLAFLIRLEKGQEPFSSMVARAYPCAAKNPQKISAEILTKARARI